MSTWLILDSLSCRCLYYISGVWLLYTPTHPTPEISRKRGGPRSQEPRRVGSGGVYAQVTQDGCSLALHTCPAWESMFHLHPTHKNMLAPKMQHARKSDHVTSMFKSLWWSSLAYKRLHLTSWVYKALYNPILMEKIRLTCRYWHMFSNHSWQHILFLQYEGLFMFLLFMPLLLPKFPPPSTTSLLNSYRLLIFPKLLWAEFVDPSSGSPEHFF